MTRLIHCSQLVVYFGGHVLSVPATGLGRPLIYPLNADGRKRSELNMAIRRSRRKISATMVFALFPALVLFVFAIRADGEPIDLKPVAPAAAKAQIASLASHVEHYDPHLKKSATRHKFMVTAHRLEASIAGPIPTWRDWLLQQKLLRTMNDPHLALYPIRLENRLLPATIDWVSNGILISPNDWAHNKPFPDNSELLKIGPYTPSALLKKRESLFPGTAEWVKQSEYMPAYYLRWIGVVNSKGDVKVEVRTPGGTVKRLAFPLVTLPENWIEKVIKHNSKTWYSWRIYTRDDVGWFTLRQMNFTKRYEQAVSAFFRAVEKAGITRVAVDVRQNGGGWSLAEAPFFEYLGAKRFRDYDKVVSLQPAALNRHISRDLHEIKAFEPAFFSHLYAGNAPTALRVSRKDRFHGTLYVVTGPGSFSSAMTFAADVKFNNLGKVVGEPCGEALTGTGNVKGFPHPPSKVPFQVPTTIYDWPGVAPGTVIQPNILIPTTVRDVQQHIDPVRRWFATTVPRTP